MYSFIYVDNFYILMIKDTGIWWMPRNIKP